MGLKEGLGKAYRFGGCAPIVGANALGIVVPQARQHGAKQQFLVLRGQKGCRSQVRVLLKST